MKKSLSIFLIFLISISAIQAQKKVFPFEKEYKWGIVNENNKQILAPTYDRISFFINYTEKDAFALFFKDRKWGLINAKGKVILPAEYDKISYLYGNKVVRVQKDGNIGAYYVAKKTFLIPISPKQNISSLDKKGNYYQFFQGNEASVIDLKRNTIIPPGTQTISAITPSADCPVFCLSSNGNQIFRDCQGNEVDKVEREQDRLPLDEIVLSSPKRGGWSDRSQEAMAMRKKVSEVHKDSLEFVRFEINKANEYYAVVVKDGKWGMVDSTGKICIPVEYDKIHKERYNLGYLFYKEYVWGLFDLEQNKILLEAKYWMIYDGSQYLQYIPEAKDYFFVFTPDKIGGCVDKVTGDRYVPK